MYVSGVYRGSWNISPKEKAGQLSSEDSASVKQKVCSERLIGQLKGQLPTKCNRVENDKVD